MQIYIDYNPLIFKNALKQIVDYCHETAQNGKLKIDITEKTNLNKLTKSIEETKTFSKIRYFIPIEYLDISFVKKSYHGRIIVDYQIKITHELTKNDLKKIKSLSQINRTFDVYDYSSIDQSKEFSLYRNLSYIKNTDDKDTIKFFYLANDNRLDTCMYSSCLGRTIYLNKNGIYSFCPKYHDKTKFSSIEYGLSNNILYGNEDFLNVLSSAVQMRKICFNNCEYYNSCQGGCPLDNSSCQRFKEKIKLALDKKSSIFNNAQVLNYQALYIEENILWSVSRGKK